MVNGMDDLASDIRTGAARVAGIYLVLAVAWIVLTDLGVLQIVFDPIALTSVQTVKGLLFVTTSAVLLYVLIAREQRRLAETNEELQLTLKHASVLHRLLRHNLRNSCDVILNNVGLLRNERGDEEAAYRRIERQTDALVDIAEKSRHLRDLVLEDEMGLTDVNLERIVRARVVAVSSEFPAVDVDVEAAAGSRAIAHPRIGIAIEELLRNAITHAEEARPAVTITITTGGDTVALAVADEGPGLPEMELAVLDGTFEEPLEHSRGIGLWLVQFLVAKSDATLETRANDPAGTVVTMTFERAA